MARKNEIIISRTPIPMLPNASKTGFPVKIERTIEIRAKEDLAMLLCLHPKPGSIRSGGYF